MLKRECTQKNCLHKQYKKSILSIDQKALAHPCRMKLPESLRREKIIIEPLADTTG